MSINLRKIRAILVISAMWLLMFVGAMAAIFVASLVLDVIVMCCVVTVAHVLGQEPSTYKEIATLVFIAAMAVMSTLVAISVVRHTIRARQRQRSPKTGPSDQQ